MAERSAAWAFTHGVEHVSLIPIRGDGDAMRALAAGGDFEPPRPSAIEDAFDRCLALGAGVVTVDAWDLDRVLRCDACRDARRDRSAMNLSATSSRGSLRARG